MRLIFRLSKPKNDKERLFKVETEVNDLKDPGEAFIVLCGKEYYIQVEYE
jgi:hypothetical protein